MTENIRDNLSKAMWAIYAEAGRLAVALDYEPDQAEPEWFETDQKLLNWAVAVRTFATLYAEARSMEPDNGFE